MNTIYDFSALDLAGQPVSLDAYRGKVLLVVNVASKCGLTPQYAGLEALYRKYRGQGLEILAFPCDQFGNQEPGSPEEIRQFCSSTYDVTFPLFGKIEVNGDGAHPLYAWLKSAKPGVLGTEAIKWNFTKFLVDRNGDPVKRFAPTDTPEDIDPLVAAQLSD